MKNNFKMYKNYNICTNCKKRGKNERNTKKKVRNENVGKHTHHKNHNE